MELPKLKDILDAFAMSWAAVAAIALGCIVLLILGFIMSQAVTAALVGTFVGGTITLVSQYLTARMSLKTKKLELLFSKKVDLYAALLDAAGQFGAAPDDAKYLIFQSRLHAALIVASEPVADALDDPKKNSLHMNAVRLRGSEDLQKIQMTAWYDSMETLKTAMRTDIAGQTSV
jgi:hypothetical protein